MGATVSIKVPQYFGFSQVEITAELAQFVAARKKASSGMASSGGGMISSGSIGGQSVSFVFPFGIGAFEEWACVLANAQADLDDETLPFRSSTSYGRASRS